MLCAGSSWRASSVKSARLGDEKTKVWPIRLETGLPKRDALSLKEQIVTTAHTQPEHYAWGWLISFGFEVRHSRTYEVLKIVGCDVF